MNCTEEKNLWTPLIKLLGLVLATRYARMGIRSLCAFAPQDDVLRFFQLGLEYIAPVAVVMLFVKSGEQRSIRSMGFTASKGLHAYLQGAALGALMIAGITALSLLSGEVAYQGANSRFALAPFVAALGLAMINIREEVLFRGWFLTTSYSIRNPLQAVLGGSVIFGLMHCGNNHASLLSIVNLVLFSIFLSELFLIRGSIWLVAAFHSMWNFTQGKLFGLPVSGNPARASLLEFEAAPDSLTAGFGLEGNLITTAVLVAAVALAARTIARKRRRALSS